MPTNAAIAAAMTIKLDAEPPPGPDFKRESGVRPAGVSS